jgi:glycosyltransferase involved in cell wall biosynthesis
MSESEVHTGTASVGLVVICTRNRPEDLGRALDAVGSIDPGLPILVADASDDDRLPAIEAIVANCPSASLLVCRPGLARQRNQALDWIAVERPDTPYVYFIDDDTVVLDGYFAAVDAAFAARPEVAGVGGVVIDHPRPRHVGAKRLFLLYGPTPGRVLRSGRPTIGHYEGDEADSPQCLPGCAMSYRLAHIEGRRFDDRLEGYSLGEDLYFSFALSHAYPLQIARNARVRHRFSEENRLSRERLARDKVALFHRFVRENREHGLLLTAFWWSILGDVVLKSIDGLLHADRDTLSEVMALVRAARHTWTRPLPARESASRSSSS